MQPAQDQQELRSRVQAIEDTDMNGVSKMALVLREHGMYDEKISRELVSNNDKIFLMCLFLMLINGTITIAGYIAVGMMRAAESRIVEIMP